MVPGVGGWEEKPGGIPMKHKENLQLDEEISIYDVFCWADLQNLKDGVRLFFCGRFFMFHQILFTIDFMRDGSLHVFATAGFNNQRTTGVFVIRTSHDVVVDHAQARYSFDHIQLLKFLTPKLFVKKKKCLFP